MNIIELNYSEQNKNVPNFGVELLKTILFFFILVYHCYDQKFCNNQILKIILEAIPLYYPTLFLLSFYFSYSYLSSKNLSKITKRFLKLTIPYFSWPIIFFIINALLDNSKIHNYSLKDLYTQLIIGRSIACVFWYQFNLIIITIIFCLIIFCSKNSNYYISILLILLILVFIFEFFEYSTNLFDLFSDNIKRSVGRLPKMIFFSIFGFVLSSIKILPILRRYRLLTILFSFSTTSAIIFFQLFISENFYYESLFMTLGSISLFIFFYMLPFEYITFGPLIFLIKQITSYSSGIYFIHIKIIEYFEDSFQAFEERTLIGCVLNYIICYCICFIGMKIFGKTKLKYLFIR